MSNKEAQIKPTSHNVVRSRHPNKVFSLLTAAYFCQKTQAYTVLNY